MYRYRFDEELEQDLSLEQVRGYEGVRVRKAYAQASQQFGVPWTGRRYDRADWSRADPINRALSAANACQRRLSHGIVSAGYSPGLGFIHTGKQLSFVYDVADLYKTELTVPLAFRLTAKSTQNLKTGCAMPAGQRFGNRSCWLASCPTSTRCLTWRRTWKM